MEVEQPFVRLRFRTQYELKVLLEAAVGLAIKAACLKDIFIIPPFVTQFPPIPCVDQG
jgi:hypothetical protein